MLGVHRSRARGNKGRRFGARIRESRERGVVSKNSGLGAVAKKAVVVEGKVEGVGWIHSLIDDKLLWGLREKLGLEREAHSLVSIRYPAHEHATANW